jgi:hypothetical protein
MVRYPGDPGIPIGFTEEERLVEAVFGGEISEGDPDLGRGGESMR